VHVSIYDRESALAGFSRCCFDVDDGRLSYNLPGQARAVEDQVAALLEQCRIFLTEIDTALERIVDNAGPQRNAFSCLVFFVRNFDKVWQRDIRMSHDCTVREFEFETGDVDYTCDAFNSDGRTLRLVDRVHGLVLGARMQGLSARWVASLVGASGSILQDALSSFSLVPEPSSSSC